MDLTPEDMRAEIAKLNEVIARLCDYNALYKVALIEIADMICCDRYGLECLCDKRPAKIAKTALETTLERRP
jgi:hypothetical protein